MVWVVEKKVFKHLVDLGFERLEIPIRVKFEFEVKEGTFVPDSLSIDTLYNRKILKNYYPQLNFDSLEKSIGRTVNKEIIKYMKNYGYLEEE